MDIEEFLKGNNPPRGDTYMFVCGKHFLDELEEMNEAYNQMQEEICRQEGFCHLYNPYSVMY